MGIIIDQFSIRVGKKEQTFRMIDQALLKICLVSLIEN